MLTLQFIPHLEIEQLSSQERLSKLIKLVKQEKIVLLEGRLKQEEETDLIRKTMEEISGNFKGIELSVIYPDSKSSDFFTKLRQSLLNIILGDRQGMTIIGPASIIKEIRQDPDKIELFAMNKRRK